MFPIIIILLWVFQIYYVVPNNLNLGLALAVFFTFVSLVLIILSLIFSIRVLVKKFDGKWLAISALIIDLLIISFVSYVGYSPTV